MSDHNAKFTPEGFIRDDQGKLIPHFKPGNCITTWFGNEHLNGHVDWVATMREVLEYSRKDRAQLAQELGVTERAIQQLINGDTSGFNCDQGLALRSLHKKLLRAKGYPIIDE